VNVETADAYQEALLGPDQALKRLMEGNARFADGHPRHPHETADWRLSLERGQHPYAVVLGCADSRVCPELVFDQGFGDLFVIRVAGNIVDVDVTASIEYAVDHLASKLVVVLGHSNCGAVTATLDHLTDSAGEPDEIVSLLYRIEPALVGLSENLPREELISQAVRKNVQFAVQRLSQVPDLRKNMRRNNLKIVGAVYNMHTGRVELLPS
jgi:carbonic anhydrase